MPQENRQGKIVRQTTGRGKKMARTVKDKNSKEAGILDLGRDWVPTGKCAVISTCPTGKHKWCKWQDGVQKRVPYQVHTAREVAMGEFATYPGSRHRRASFYLPVSKRVVVATLLKLWASHSLQ
jgi:hypothetical protein